MSESHKIESRFNHNTPPFIIAELSGNHNQSLETAIAMVDAAAKAGLQLPKTE